MKNKSLIQICFGSFDIQFNFKEEISIMSGDKIEVFENDIKYVINLLSDCSMLLIGKLINKKVVSINVLKEKDIELSFENGIKLFILFTENVYESYTITWVGGNIVV